ncbi:hypothetical protein F4859DRAFT_518620 [Xylaria cf. heliscus]|nr:hypothetical protein F4859DRAFT_518620 [Xylaria cf. heliscus]
MAGLEPPPGQESNLMNPPNRNVEGHVGLAVSITLVFLGVSVRAYSKIFCVKRIAIQDVGYYVHQWDIPARDLPYVLHIIYLGMVMYEATMATLKVSILSEWIQIFVPPKMRNTFFWTSVAIIGVNVAYYLSSILAVSLSCPTRATLCDRSSVIFICSAVINLLSDLTIFVLPIRAIWQLQLPRSKKISISFVFGLGLITCASASVRLYESVGLYTSPDKTFGISGTTLWCLTELTIAYLVFCAPAAPRAFQDSWISRKISSKTKSSSSTASSRGPRKKADANIGNALRQHDQQGLPPSHAWQRIYHDENDADSTETIRGAVRLQSFHASAKGRPSGDGLESADELRGIRVESHVAVSTGEL